jgi:hypothetical protein
VSAPPCRDSGLAAPFPTMPRLQQRRLHPSDSICVLTAGTTQLQLANPACAHANHVPIAAMTHLAGVVGCRPQPVSVHSTQ